MDSRYKKILLRSQVKLLCTELFAIKPFIKD